MTYSDFIYRAGRYAIGQLDNGTWYVEPEWKDIICREITDDISGLDDSYVSDWLDVENILRLEVERRNANNSKKKEIIDWLYELIMANVEPAVMQEETDFIKQVVEFMKTNHEKKDNIIQFPTNKE